MADLETLRPEVREAINRTDMTVEMFDTLVTVNRDDYDIIRAELLRLEGECGRLDRAWQCAVNQALENGQRAKRAEAELAALTKKCTCSRRSVSSPMGCRVCNPQLEIADLESKLATSEAELAEAQNTIAAQQGTMGALKRKLALAEGELAALKARIAEAQECGVVALCGGGASLSHEPYPSLVGKRVRLVVDDPPGETSGQ